MITRLALLWIAVLALARPAAAQEAGFELDAHADGRRLLQRYIDAASWETFREGGVRAYASPAWRSEAVAAARAAAAHLPRIARALDLEPEAILPVWIVVSPGSGGMAREAPSWSAAVAQPARHLIVLSGPALRRTRLDLEETVAHELAHLAFGVRLGDLGWAPRWFDEGLAMRLSGYRRLSDRLTRLGRGPVRLDELVDVFPQNPTLARQAYLESEAAVRALAERAPLGDFLDRLAEGEEFDIAFQDVYGETPRRFAESIDAQVARRWRWLSLVGGSLSLFGVASLLLVIGVVRQRLRNRRRMRAWEAEESADLAARDAGSVARPQPVGPPPDAPRDEPAAGNTADGPRPPQV